MLSFVLLHLSIFEEIVHNGISKRWGYVGYVYRVIVRRVQQFHKYKANSKV